MTDSVETVEMKRPNFDKLTSVDKFWLEFDQKLHESTFKIEYPLINIRKRPWSHSITKRLMGYQYNIMCACTGFSKTELKVVVHDKVLYVSAHKADYKREEVKEYKYIGRNIKDKDFEFNIPLTDGVKVEGVSVSNGILFITLAIGNPVIEQPKEFEII